MKPSADPPPAGAEGSPADEIRVNVPGSEQEAEELEARPAPPPAGEAAPSDDVKELRDRWLRAEAETQNVRRRAAREREELRRELEDQWLLELIAVIDDLDRGLEAARKSGAPDAWISGFELSGRRLREILTRHGVTAVDPLGEPFDPRLHEAMIEVEAPAEIAPGHVAQVIHRGWARNGRSLRPAQVTVARGGS